MGGIALVVYSPFTSYPTLQTGGGVLILVGVILTIIALTVPRYWKHTGRTPRNYDQIGFSFELFIYLIIVASQIYLGISSFTRYIQNPLLYAESLLNIVFNAITAIAFIFGLFDLLFRWLAIRRGRGGSWEGSQKTPGNESPKTIQSPAPDVHSARLLHKGQPSGNDV